MEWRKEVKPADMQGVLIQLLPKGAYFTAQYNKERDVYVMRTHNGGVIFVTKIYRWIPLDDIEGEEWN